MTVIASGPRIQINTRHMPEFEEENVNASPSESYAPRTDASKKPRTRRRSGGFKTEVANVSNACIGEVSVNQALKEEKLSGKPSAIQSHAPREPRTEANPQPSPETLAAIASVEAKIAKRRAERDSRRARRNERKSIKQGGDKPAHKKGLFASILSIFGFGPKAEPTKKRGGNRGRRHRGRDGSRGEQNRRNRGQNRRRRGQGGHRNNRHSKEKPGS